MSGRSFIPVRAAADRLDGLDGVWTVLEGVDNSKFPFAFSPGLRVWTGCGRARAGARVRARVRAGAGARSRGRAYARTTVHPLQTRDRRLK